MADNSGEPAENKDSGKLDDRLGQLNAQLAEIRKEDAEEQKRFEEKRAGTNGLAMAWRLGSEFIAGVLVGGGVGWLIDRTFGVEPWGLIIFILLGFLAGMLNMLRSAGKLPPPGA